jgi:hypothetical protein
MIKEASVAGVECEIRILTGKQIKESMSLGEDISLCFREMGFGRGVS